jgi:rubrerythrin
MTTEVLEMIEALAENEMLVSRLYRVFSEWFPDHRDFWGEMAEEEAQHANMIRSLSQDVREGAVRFKEDALDTTSAQMFHDYLKFSLARTLEQGISLEDAFETALAIEHDLIEKGFFTRFQAKTEDLALIFEGLMSSTREHHRRLEEAVAKSRRSAH